MKKAVLLCALMFSASFVPCVAQDNNNFEVSKNLDIFNSVVKETEMFYTDTFDVTKVVRRGIDAMLDGLDPYTEYIPDNEMDSFKQLVTGEYGGIGSLIRQRNAKGNVMIAGPTEGMPADLAGLKSGDLILKIDTTDVTGFTNDKVSALLKGVPNTKVMLTIQRPGEKKTRKVEIIRKQIVVKQVGYYGVLKNNIGYINLTQFTDKSGDEVRDAFLDMKNNQHIKGLILDLRGNGGGALEAAVQIVGMFVPKGSEVISTKGKVEQWNRTYRSTVDPIDTVMPLAVMINSGSASASEIVSGSLQDYDRAILVGERSFGKGLVQSTRDLPYNGKLKVTISHYFIPSGRCIQQLDYSHRLADGTVAAIPDSLTHVFYTAKKRPVRDGGGLRPDFSIEEPKVASMLYYLATDTVLFDYVTNWCQKHPTVAPVEKFTLSDEDFNDFCKYAKEKNFTYDRQSVKALKNLKEVADFEGYLKDDSTLLKTLEDKLTPNFERDFNNNKKEIKKLISTEIMSRYYYKKGEILESLKDDNGLEKAISVLSDPALYAKTLSAPDGKLADVK